MQCRYAFAALATMAGCSLSHAADYPKRPIRIVVGYAAGGTTDILARALAEQLSIQLKQPVIIDNKAGAAGNLAAAFVQQSPADGYTLLMATVSSHGINPGVYSKATLGYDPVAGFTPVSMVASIPLVLVCNPQLPVKTVPDLVALARQRAGALNYASGGNGSPVHLAGALFGHMAGAKLEHVPYRGGAQANISVMSGETQLTFASLPAALPHIRAGKLRALAVTTTDRSPLLPAVPAMREVPGFSGYEVSTWNALMAPANTPPAVIDVLNKAVAQAVALPQVQDRFRNEGAVASSSTSATLGAFVAVEVARWSAAARDLKIKAD